MYQPRVNPSLRTWRARSEFSVDRRRLRNPQIDAEPTKSPLDALARGLVTIGERVRSRPRLRVL
jgi:hypothetical protein